MMKKILIALGVLVVIVAAVFGARYLTKRSYFSQTVPSGQIATTTGTGEEMATSTRPKSEDDALRSRAMRIVDRPIMVKVDLSDSLKQMAIQKIKDTSDMIRANYDFDKEWYDLGAYRKLIGDYEGADDAWSFVISIRPNDFVSLHNLGSMYYDLKNYPKAEQYFSASIANNPKNIDAYIQLAAIYEYNDLSKTSLIEPLLLGGIRANPDSANLLIALGKYYQATGNLTGARDYFEQALKLNPKNTALEQELQSLGK